MAALYLLIYENLLVPKNRATKQNSALSRFFALRVKVLTTRRSVFHSPRSPVLFAARSKLCPPISFVNPSFSSLWTVDKLTGKE